MKIGLASSRFVNGNMEFNLSQIKKALRRAQGKADLLCFGEAFLQGFDALCWDYETDREIAIAKDSQTMCRLAALTLRSKTDLLFGYIERDGEKLYSSCALLAHGELLCNYRRISKGWKEVSRTGAHYCEGTGAEEFVYRGVPMKIALCGDIWEAPERFRTDGVLLWPVYVDYTPGEWETAGAEYAAQAAKASRRVLMVNSLCSPRGAHGGAFEFLEGRIAARLACDTEAILLVEV